MRWLSLILLFFLCFKATLAVEQINYDSSHIEIRKASEDKISEYQNNSDFLYHEVQKNGNSFMDYVVYYVQRFLYAFFSDEGIMPFVRYLIIILFIAFVVYQLTKNKLQGVFSRKSQNSGIVYDLMEENLSAEDFDKLIAKERANRNFSLVIRLYYLKMLKTLDKKGLINWQQNKTNRDYYYDLEGSGIEGKYQQLTWVYENIWYGNFNVKEDYFNRTGEEFIKLFKELENNES